MNAASSAELRRGSAVMDGSQNNVPENVVVAGATRTPNMKPCEMNVSNAQCIRSGHIPWRKVEAAVARRKAARARNK